MSAVARRFYDVVSVATAGPGASAVMLDERELRTPGGLVFRAPTRALAEVVAEEWDRQVERIEPRAMPITQLAFSALDGGANSREERIAYIAAFAETDLCCHRAEATVELAAAQEQAWGPLLCWLDTELAVSLPVVQGIVAAPSKQAVLVIADHAGALDDFRLIGLAQATGLTGSAVIGLALLHGEIDAGRAFEAATVDEAWNLARWGRDAEAVARLELLRAELGAVARYFAALRDD